MDSPTCRVCRTEASTDQPLFHPCRCRGSMKYIHQECLEFWLQHSNKRSCDICHTPFRFNIIYDESAPKYLPLRYIIAQAFSYFVSFQYLAVKSILALMAVFQTFYSFSLLNSLIDILLGVDIDPPPLLPSSISLFFARFTSGALSAAVYSLLTVAMVLIQNSFILDPGFQKIIDTRIGKAIVARSERIGVMINRLQQLQQNHQHPIDDALAQSYRQSGVPDPDADTLTIDQLFSMRIFALRHASTVNSPYTDHIDDAIHNVLTFSPTDQHTDESRVASFRQAERTIREAVVAQEQREVADADASADAPAPQPAPADLEELANILAEARNDFPAAQQQEDDAPLPPQEEIGFFSNKKTIAFIIQMAFIANVASLALLILHKFFPSVVASLAFPLFAKVLLLLKRSYKYVVPITIAIYKYIAQYTPPTVLQLTASFIYNNIISPITLAISNITNGTPSDSPFERIFAQLSGIAIIIATMRLIMWKMERSCSQQNPLTGTYRTVYISLLQFVSVFKVLTLLVIEWILFPLFAGSQVEFALVPIFNDNLYTYQLEPQPFNHLLPKLLIKWFIGTFFMYYFASFVSMIRTTILRPGVLFFIRPSDDPNVQIVHDAIMRPFMLRLSRIALSGAVYSVYIHLQFTIPAWSLRLLSPVPILPFYSTIVLRYAYASLFILSKFMEPFFIKFWSRAFNIGCRLTHLSHFMLNKDDPSEHISGGYFTRVPDNDHVSRRFVRTLFYPVTPQDTLINPLPPIPDDEAYFNPYGDVDPLEIDTYTVVYRPPQFKPRLIALFLFLELASLLYTAALYIANICTGKLILNLTHISHACGLPTEFYKVDIFSLLITFAILSQSPQLATIFQNGHIDVSILTHVRSQLTAISQNRFVVFAFHRAETLLQIIAFLHAINYALGTYIITNNSTLLMLGALTMLAPITAFIRGITPDKRKFTILSALILVSRIAVIFISHTPHIPDNEVLSLIESTSSMEELIEVAHKHALHPDTYITTRIISLFFPEPFTRFFYHVEFAHYESTESAIYFVAWCALAAWSGLRYLAHGWNTFSEHTRERYFANNKILANVDDE